MARKSQAIGRCWVDLYSGSRFAGNLVRVPGPGPIANFSAGSLICGPDATLMLTVFQKEKREFIQFDPSEVVKDVSRQTRGAKLVEAAIVLTPTDSKSKGAPKRTARRSSRSDRKEERAQ
jgi:hypothetical protein